MRARYRIFQNGTLAGAETLNNGALLRPFEKCRPERRKRGAGRRPHAVANALNLIVGAFLVGVNPRLHIPNLGQDRVLCTLRTSNNLFLRCLVILLVQAHALGKNRLFAGDVMNVLFKSGDPRVVIVTHLTAESVFHRSNLPTNPRAKITSGV